MLRAFYFLFLMSFFCGVSDAYAQVTLNFDDLSDDFISDKKVERSQKIQLTPISHNEIEKKQENKTKKIKKTEVKKDKVKQTHKQTKKTSQTNKKNYIIKNREKEDAHDKLKPRSEPVPVVKIQEIEKQIEELASQEVIVEPTKEETVKKDILNKSAKLDDTKKDTVEIALPLEKQETASKDLSTKLDSDVQKIKSISNSFIKSTSENRIEQTVSQEKTITNQDNFFPIFTINEKNLSKRSDFLKKYIPDDSKSFLDLQKGKNLYSILIFEKLSSHLTNEMDSEIDKIVLELRKNKKLNLIIYSYSGPTDPEYGREHHLSLQRALRVRSSFSQKGISIHRITYRSWGKIGAGNEYPDRVDILLTEK